MHNMLCMQYLQISGQVPMGSQCAPVASKCVAVATEVVPVRTRQVLIGYEGDWKAVLDTKIPERQYG
jgi:3D (Asp-Asp-Asp) domain-containing protein